jgi:hypothetical protein
MKWLCLHQHTVPASFFDAAVLIFARETDRRTQASKSRENSDAATEKNRSTPRKKSFFGRFCIIHILYARGGGQELDFKSFEV